MFLFHTILIDGLESCGLLVDYCDVFISCLDSHSDSPYPLVILAMDVIPKKQTHLGWSESE